MSLGIWIRERSAEALGKIGLIGVVTSETGKAAGIFDNVTAIQVISTAGISIMIIERSFNLYWKAKENGNEKLTLSILALFWISLLLIIYSVLSWSHLLK